VKKGVVNIAYIDTTRMVADGLTKALTVVKFKAFINLLNLQNIL
jgi:hypothetical protein